MLGCVGPLRSIRGRRMRSSLYSGPVISLVMIAWMGQAQSLSLRCTPVPDTATSAKDPIQTILVSVTGQEWHVTHIAASGARFDREQQYSLHDTSSAGLLSWTGLLNSHPYLSMFGRVTQTDGGYIYDENVVDARKGG